jgi:predicted DNA-binding transcriptional regulator AlpA
MDLIITTPEVLAQNIENAVFKALSKIEKASAQPLEQPDRINIEEVAIITGLKKSNIYKHTCYQTIPYEKFAKRLVFSRKAILAWMQSNTIAPVNPSIEMSTQLTKMANKKLKASYK